MTRLIPPPPNVTAHETLSTKEVPERLSVQGFHRGWSRRDPLPSTYRDSRPPEEKQVFSMNYTVLQTI